MIKDPASLAILKTGPGTSIQDLGRVGFGQFGIPISGALDIIATKWVNHLLKNKESEAVLEISQPGLKIHFEAPTQICLAGAKSKVFLNGNQVNTEGLIEIDFGDLVEIGEILIGSKIYLGIKHGFRIHPVMQSKSFYEGILGTGNLKKGDQIGYFTNHEKPISSSVNVKFDRNWMCSETIVAYRGPEWHFLLDTEKELIVTTSFTVSSLQNRMAIQLNELIPNSLEEMATAAVYPGTVQLTSGGKMIVLMKDAQVTGGYPRVLQLPELSIAQIAQKKPGERITFEIEKGFDFSKPH
ncbi:biotin-dependent carboxyltransferase family protein [Algoriphagus aestuarii]|nr:biotin-dependent carboxyltransferase family protein [Algoriphagus aestuarii]